MADAPNSKLIYTVQLDEGKTEARIKALKVGITDLKTQKTELDKAFKAGQIDAAGYADKLHDIEKATKAANAELRDQIKSQETQSKVLNSNADSLEQNRAKLSLLTNEYVKLSKVDRESEFGVKLQQNIRGLSDSLKTNEKDLGDSRRNVGNYIQDLNVMGIRVGDVSEKIKGGGEGFLTFGRAILSTRGALVALTAIPIVLLLTTVVSFLTKSKDGMEFFGRKVAAVTAVVDLFIGKAVSLGRNLVEALSNPVEAVKALGKAIQENLTNRFAAFGLIIKAVRSGSFKDFTNAVLQLGTGVENVTGKLEELGKEAAAAASAGEAVAKETYAIADAERRLNVERQKSRAQVEELKLLSDDVSKSQKVREDAVRKAYSIEKGLLDQQLVLQERKINNLKAEAKLSADGKGNLNEIAEAEKEKYAIQEESATRRTELNNKVNQIQIEGQKAVLAAQIATLNEGLRLTQERGFQTLEIEKKILAKQLAFDLVGVVKKSEQEKAITLEYKAKLNQLIYADVLKQNEQQNKIDNDALQVRLLAAREGSQERLRVELDIIKQRRFEEEATARLTIKNKVELESTLSAINAKAAADKKAVQKQIRDEELRLLDETLQTRLLKTKAGSKAEYDAQIALIRQRLANALADESLAIEEFQRIQAESFRAIDDLNETRLQNTVNKVADVANQINGALSGLINSSIENQTKSLDKQQAAALQSAALSAEQRAAIEADFQQKKEKLEKEAAKKRKAIALAETVINTARGIVAASPVLPLMALAAAVGVAQALVIESTQFARGGVINGPSHAEGGVKYRVGNRNVELEGNEGVINKRSMAIPWVREQASYLNQVGGGIAFPGTAAIAHSLGYTFAAGGVLPSGGGGVVDIDYQRLAAAMAALPAPRVALDEVATGIRTIELRETNSDY